MSVGMIAKESTFAEILSTAKSYIVNANIVGTAAVALSSSVPDAPPLSPGTGNVVIVLSPGPSWTRLDGVYGESSDIMLQGQLVVTVWNPVDSADLIGTSDAMLTDSLLSANSVVNQVINLFDVETLGSMLAILATVQGDCTNFVTVSGSTLAHCYYTPLMDSLHLESITMPQKKEGITRQGFHLSFFCKFKQTRT